MRANPAEKGAPVQGASGRFQLRLVRLSTGLVLFLYVLTHLLNHTLGLWSLPALEWGRGWFLALWRNPVGTVMLYGSLAIHFLLALWAIYQHRRLLGIPRGEAAQLVLGLAIVPLLADHVLTTRLIHELFDTWDSYTYVLLVLWSDQPGRAVLQAVLLLVAWLHGCMGLRFWLRLKPWYAGAYPILLSIALLLPTLALLGFVHGGRAALLIADDPRRLVSTMVEIGWPNQAAVDLIDRIEAYLLAGWLAALALALAARVVRNWRRSRRPVVELTYPDGLRVEVPVGTSVLEASQLASIPHASVCGGRGRCSTCRVRIGVGLSRLAPPVAAELRVLRRIAAPPNVRLACQLRPLVNLAVVPLLPPSAKPRDGFARPPHFTGEEREIAVLFADLRGFTRLSERNLPYDVVFLMNRFFEVLGQAVEQTGGRIDKFIGDGIMALFGITDGPAAGCRDALIAAKAIVDGLDRLNETLKADLKEPLRVGIGVHGGPAIVGEMGYGAATSVTAIGDTVNAANRLEALTKTYSCQLIVSYRAARYAGIDLSAHPSGEIALRGRRQPMPVHVIEDVRRLPA